MGSYRPMGNRRTLQTSVVAAVSAVSRGGVVTASMQAKQQADADKQAQEEAQQKADQEAQQKSQDESNNSDNNNGGDNSTSTVGTDGSNN